MLAFSAIFLKRLGIFLLHAYYTFLSTLEYKSLFNYLPLRRSYAILSATTQRAFSIGLYAIACICYRPSVCPFFTRVDQSKMVEDRIMQFSPYISPIHLVFLWDKIHPEILTGSPERGRQRRMEWGKQSIF